ncbi:hypothetical protein KIN20_012351 [Parelaphostrongylus tenuis]|uniref:Uncharacterized protein n=1 Tax=Parelaphostrongylus tenuis TaxID=148309 RepID=A0AAD5MW38_PARTN|nr:hypothetical protein KIN20_012351 [Parelaphostrongylus tenuis]
MELYTEQKRLLTLYEHEFGSNAADVARRINKAWGDRTLENQQSASDFMPFRYLKNSMVSMEISNLATCVHK